MTKFIFDLDGTITKQETLPLISSYFNVQEEIDKLTLKKKKFRGKRKITNET